LAFDRSRSQGCGWPNSRAPQWCDVGKSSPTRNQKFQRFLYEQYENPEKERDRFGPVLTISSGVYRKIDEAATHTTAIAKEVIGCDLLK
jgi:hypothetical protein